MKVKLHAKILGPLTLGNLSEAASKALKADLPETDEDEGLFGPEHSSWTYWELGKVIGVDATNHVTHEIIYVAERTGSFGPREPAFVWTGTRWICSEDELSDEEEELMDAVSGKCPGGLAGWS